MFDFDFRPLLWLCGVIGFAGGVTIVLVVQFLMSHVSLTWS